jgi:DNA-binding response OmpR family regulator
VAAGREARTLIALRRTLAADGVGVSLAWDAVQLRDLCELVHPQLVVVDLGLPRSAHEAILALGLRRHVPDLVLASDGDDARAFAAAFERLARRERLPRRHEGLGLLLGLATPSAPQAHRAHG